MAEGAILFKPILILLLFSVVTAIFMIAVSAFLGPKRKKKSKLSVYECGAVPKQETARQRYSVKFFIIAMLFILFDIEIAFLYPWAVVYKKFISSGSFILVEMAFFVAVLLVGYAYIWWKGALEWE